MSGTLVDRLFVDQLLQLIKYRIAVRLCGSLVHRLFVDQLLQLIKYRIAVLSMASDHSNSSEMASTSSPNDVESFPKNEKSTPNVDLEELGEKEGYVLDSSLGGANLKTTENGRTILIPQPSEDPNDPLNWSWFRKHLFLIIIGATSFLPDYGSATGAVTLIPQSM